MRLRQVSSLAVAAVAAAAVLYALNPERYGIYPRCPLYALTGLKCAGCGTLRAAHYALHGDFARAFAFNPFLAVAAPALLALFLKPEWMRNRYVGWGIAAAFILYSVARNL